ncbi:transposase family protein [Streptomyces sp. BR123]|uniref:transposase family protein n=1 Tax=Streptomyces sp. BR123 TaxID=2749828 RepID=UPI002811874F|nr:transposase family protein [Streptomyces sp. BR123]
MPPSEEPQGPTPPGLARQARAVHTVGPSPRAGKTGWWSPTAPGRTHDNTAARHDHILAHLRAAGLGVLADLGFRGLDNNIHDPVIVTGYAATRTHRLTPGQKEANRVLAIGRAPVEHGFAHLKNWRIPTPAGPARPDEPRSQPLTNDLLRGLTPTTSTRPGGPVTPAL